jgi:hypothetical protein
VLRTFEKLSLSGVVRTGLLLGCGLGGAAILQARGDDGAQAPTQQEFAIKLSRALGHEVDKDGASAIKLLSSVLIVPGHGPDAKWEPEAPATTKFVAAVQASLQLLLKRTAEDLAIAPPPTLDLFIFELPPGPQKVFFPAEDPAAQQTSAEDGASPGKGKGAPVDAPEAIGPPAIPMPSRVVDPDPGTARVTEAAATPPPPQTPPFPQRTQE